MGADIEFGPVLTEILGHIEAIELPGRPEPVGDDRRIEPALVLNVLHRIAGGRGHGDGDATLVAAGRDAAGVGDGDRRGVADVEVLKGRHADAAEELVPLPATGGALIDALAADA